MADFSTASIVAIILGGGAGSRLRPLTLHRSKPAVPLAGKYRLIDIPVSNCINSGVNRIFVLTQYNSASLNRHLTNTYTFDRFSGGFVQVLAAEQTPGSMEWFQGTADAVRQSLTHVQNYRHSHVLILSGDQLYLMDYREMLLHHLETASEVTVATIPVHANDAPGFGILKTDEEGRISEFHEKPSDLEGKDSPVEERFAAAERHYLASMGIYLFDADVLQRALDDHPDAVDFGKQILPSLIGTHAVSSFPFDGYWSDIGTVRSFYDANLALALPKPEFDLYSDTMPLYTNARSLPPAKIHDSFIQDSLVADASVIVRARVVSSVVGVRSYIGERATVERTVMMGADYLRWQDVTSRRNAKGPPLPGVGEDSVVVGAIIDKNVSIGRRCVITNRDGIVDGEGPGFYIRDGIVVLAKNAIIPDETFV
ncbi:MAG: glucose-1-phosphate adenylyltransferase [Bacteroidetes bacterium]|nr:glucose-1-phosphate adenylyltransferase [Bacteroidota bacterium]